MEENQNNIFKALEKNAQDIQIDSNNIQNDVILSELNDNFNTSLILTFFENILFN